MSRTHHPAGPGRDGTLRPLSAIGFGLAAGALRTAAMDALLFARYRRDGGASRFVDWESSAGVTDWEQAPAPAQEKPPPQLAQQLIQNRLAAHVTERLELLADAHTRQRRRVSEQLLDHRDERLELRRPRPRGP